MTDKRLLRLLLKDANAGMEQLINRYAGLVYTVVRGKLADSYYISSDIEDCVADVFSSFYTRLSDYDPEVSSIKSYLCVIARNNAINILKKRARGESVSLDGEQSLFWVADDITIESKLEEDELRREVIQAIKELGEPDTSIIFRKFYYGQCSKDIAEALGLSVSNVDTRTHRALIKLRKKFGDENHEENNK